jgi:hypothetical protein
MLFFAANLFADRVIHNTLPSSNYPDTEVCDEIFIEKADNGISCQTKMTVPYKVLRMETT